MLETIVHLMALGLFIYPVMAVGLLIAAFLWKLARRFGAIRLPPLRRRPMAVRRR